LPNLPSAAEVPRFVGLITNFTRKIEGIGPVGQAEGEGGDEVMLKVAAAKSAVGGMRLRTSLGNLAKDFRKDNDYSLETVRRRVAEKLGPAIKTEVGGQEILLRLKRQGPLSTADLTGKVGLGDKEVADFLGKLGKKGQVAEKDGCWSVV